MIYKNKKLTVYITLRDNKTIQHNDITKISTVELPLGTNLKLEDDTNYYYYDFRYIRELRVTI